MSVLARIDNAERFLTPKINNTTQVNPQPMDDVQVELVNDELAISMRGHLGPNGEYPGALVGFSIPPLNSILGVPIVYASMSYENKTDEVSNALIAAREGDLKWCLQAAPTDSTPILNVADGSCQKVGGGWQIDDKTGVWVPAGFNPGPSAPNVWNKSCLQMSVNPSLNQFSMQSISDNGTLFKVPSNLQNLPLQSTTWGDTGVQIQFAINKAGQIMVLVRNITVIFSDEPIGA